MKHESAPASVQVSLGKVTPPLKTESGCTEIEIEERFLRSLYLEQRRSERSGRRFVLMLLESDSLFRAASQSGSADRLLAALRHTVRETDVVGWHKTNYAIGIIFTEIGEADDQSVGTALLTRVSRVLAVSLPPEGTSQIRISLNMFPEDWKDRGGGRLHDPAVFPDVPSGAHQSKAFRKLKRALDILLSLLAILLLSPILVAIAIAVKLTSKGPVLFKQRRLGLDGLAFTMLKFRSMRTDISDTPHRDFVKHFINGGSGSSEQPGEDKPVYKLTEDARLTRIGGFLRRSSLDELPQLLNVLQGDMSLVGPRPPLSYEVDDYRAWHRRRLCGIMPGITGLWQVTGRSKVTFDEMVRMDLEYARSWSLWLDAKILWRTVVVVLRGQGAY